MQDRIDEAYDAFYKSVWNDAWQLAGYLQLARIACMRGDDSAALDLIDKSLHKNYHSHTARHAKTFILRKLNKHEEALAVCKASLEIDPFNFGCHYENYLLYLNADDDEKAAESLALLNKISRKWEHNFIEYAFDYANAGLWEEAIRFLKVQTTDNAAPYPMILYYLGYFSMQLRQPERALEYFSRASKLNPDYCFPNRIEDINVLRTATAVNPGDSRAFHYLGNLWYDKRQYKDAIACWERSVELDASYPIPFRNLSLAYYNKLQQKDKALHFMESAFSLNTTDSRILMELDQLYKLTGKCPAERLSLLDSYNPLVEDRDDLYLEKVTLYNNVRQFAKAKQLLEARKFHPWEGGEGKVVAQYFLCCHELAKQAISDNQYQQALELLKATEQYPVNLGEGKIYGTTDNEMHYLLGCAYEGLGSKEKAISEFKKATKGDSEPVQAIYYNDPRPDEIMYRALAWIKLGKNDKAKAIFEHFIAFGEMHIDDEVSIDYFAVSLPDMLVFDKSISLSNTIHCKYLIGLGWLGLGNTDQANKYLNEVLALDTNHQGALIYSKMFSFFENMNNVQSITY